MGEIFSNDKGTERNYNDHLTEFSLTPADSQEIEDLFKSIRDIGRFYKAEHVDVLQILWHRFCYKHKLILNKIRLHSQQLSYAHAFDVKYEIGFNALWHCHNDVKIPIECFKIEKANKKSLLNDRESVWSMYIGLKGSAQTKRNIMKHINDEFSLNCKEYECFDDSLMDIICRLLPSHHVLNYHGKDTLELCRYEMITPTQSDNRQTVNETVQSTENLLSVIDLDSMRWVRSFYSVGEHEILQFVQYILYFFYHQYVDEWAKSHCVYQPREDKLMKSALIEVSKIWDKKSRKSYPPRKIPVK